MTHKLHHLFAILILGVGILFSSCSKKEERNTRRVTKEPEVSVSTSTAGVPAGLDLKALGSIVQSAPDAKTIEKKVNEPGGINNLDFNEDGEVDYISVDEYNKGFAFYTDFPEEEIPVAEVEVEKESPKQAAVHISGSEYVYGSNPPHYSSRMDMSDLILASWFFSNHSPYRSSFGYGRYPSYYDPYQTVPHERYTKRVTKTYRKKSNTNYYQSKSKSKNSTSPNAKRSKKIKNDPKTHKKYSKSKYAKRNTSDRSFTRRSSKKSVGKGGFGKKNTTRSTTGNKNRKKSSTSTKKSKKSNYNNRSSKNKSRRSFGKSRKRRKSRSRSRRRRRSDARLKTHVQRIDQPLVLLSQINGYHYQWNRKAYPQMTFANRNEEQYGLMAQELLEVMPEMVEKDQNGHYRVDYEMMVPVLLEAIKQQEQRIQRLERQIKHMQHG